MKALFVATAVITFALGVAWTLFPGPMLGGWGVHGDEATTYIARRYGGLFFGYAAILWLSRRSDSSPARTAILAGSAVVTTVMAIVSVVGVVTKVVSPVVWGVVALEGLLAIGFIAFYVLAGRQAASPTD